MRVREREERARHEVIVCEVEGKRMKGACNGANEAVNLQAASILSGCVLVGCLSESVNIVNKQCNVATCVVEQIMTSSLRSPCEYGVA